MEKFKKTGFVKLTKKAIEEMFDLCNERYFDNKIEKPKKFETWTPHKKVAGMVRGYYDYKRQKTTSFLHISRMYNWTEENLRDTMVHEMIHLYNKDFLIPLTFVQRWFGWLPWVDNNPHDENFVEMMNDLNVRFPEIHVVVQAKHLKAYKRW